MKQLIYVGQPLFTVILITVATSAPLKAQQRSLKQCLANYGNGIGCQIPRSGSYPYDCEYNQKAIKCSGFKNNQIKWEDGVVTTIWLVRPATDLDNRKLRSKGLAQASSLYTDKRSGRWWLNSFPNGNQLWINEVTGNSIFVPLRAACQPPLKGNLGYCTPP